MIGAPDDDLGQGSSPSSSSRDGHDAGDDLAEALIGHVAEQLSEHKRPRAGSLRRRSARNAMGKVTKKALLGTS